MHSSGIPRIRQDKRHVSLHDQKPTMGHFNPLGDSSYQQQTFKCHYDMNLFMGKCAISHNQNNYFSYFFLLSSDTLHITHRNLIQCEHQNIG